ncbi:MAG: carbon storage regulator [Patescibacteria group bacterium]
MGVGQAIVIGDNIKIMVVEINGGQVRLGTEAHRSILVYRKELLEQINAHASARPDVATVAKVKTPVLAKVHLGRLVSVRCKELLVRLIRKLHL